MMCGFLFGPLTSKGNSMHGGDCHANEVCSDPVENSDEWDRTDDESESTNTYQNMGYALVALLAPADCASERQKKEALAETMTQTCPDLCYVGEVKGGYPHGIGTLVCRDSIVYAGEWKKGVCLEQWGALLTEGKTVFEAAEAATRAFDHDWRVVRKGYVAPYPLTPPPPPNPNPYPNPNSGTTILTWRKCPLTTPTTTPSDPWMKSKPYPKPDT